MDADNTWVSHYQYGTVKKRSKLNLFSDVDDEINIVSVDSILPGDLLEKILAYLPIPTIFRAGSVCKRWHHVVTSKRFLLNFSARVLSHNKPWYFMFIDIDEYFGYSFDPTLEKWYGIRIPYFVTSDSFIASSFGLVCVMNIDNRYELHVCNPITKCSKKLSEPPGARFPDYSALAISVDKKSQNYNVCVVKSKQVPDNFYQWNISIHFYNSETMMWVTLLREILNEWRAGDESVICDGALYCLLYSTGFEIGIGIGFGMPDNRHGLIKYNLSSYSSTGLLMGNFIPTPFSLTCGRLMNLKEKLVMVGGIGKEDYFDKIKGICIWVLKGSEWQEVARMPHMYFHRFRKFDDVFASSGTEDLIYIQSYDAPALVLFDMNRKQWKWSRKCPATERFRPQLFTGFCFEPRLEVSP